ncbi:TonB-dependent siderophore receptor [Pseudomonas taiwanensis]|uniref:TonB-dependent siderophore receptor n=1 Tax=Pseudomonas taiwanensis TaxID=470150 RepID=UPI0015BC533B|nr:TonB-dependent siderophore receptor [Pseudomonas taiwanensis]NWL79940.1 TonB-dependent siderophore receptor [Pseudomonas taiwanensis]
MRLHHLAPASGLLLSLLGEATAAETYLPLLLDDIQIDDRHQESADDPVRGYLATRSTSATRTDTDIRDIPQAISVVPAQVLEDLDISRLDRALDFAGGVSRQNNFGGLTFLSYSIRGFTTGELYKNGFAINRGSYSSPDASTIERIDVLKGPAASLYGRGDPGGTVNIVTRKPQAERFSRLKASAGSWDRYRASLDVNAPLDEEDKLLSRINLATEDNGSYRDHAGNQRLVVSPSLSWQLNADTRLLLETEFVQHESVFDRGIPAVNGELGSVKRSTFLGEPNDGEIRNRNQMVQASLEHHLNDSWKLRLANHYAQGHLQGDATEVSRLIGNQVSRFYRQRDFEWNDSITQLELHGLFETGSWLHQTLAGLEYENYRNSQKYPQSLASLDYGLDIYNPVYGKPKPTIVNPNDFFEQVKSRALNLQDQIDFGHGWKGLIGARFERFEQTALNRTTRVSNDQNKDSLTLRSGVLYQLTPEVGLFANAATSVKPNAISSQGTAFEPEKGFGKEAGLKLDLLEGRLGATAALFHIDKENVLTADPTNPGESIAAGRARSQGLDLQVSGQLTDAVRLIGAYAYIDAEVTKDNVLPEGSRLLGVPEHSGSLLAVYEFQGGRLRGSDVGATFNYVGDRSGQAGSQFELPAYATFDLLAHHRVSERTTLGLNLNNLFDRKYYERSYNSVWVMPGEPRNLNLSLTLEL